MTAVLPLDRRSSRSRCSRSDVAAPNRPAERHPIPLVDLEQRSLTGTLPPSHVLEPAGRAQEPFRHPDLPRRPVRRCRDAARGLARACGPPRPRPRGGQGATRAPTATGNDYRRVLKPVSGSFSIGSTRGARSPWSRDYRTIRASSWRPTRTGSIGRETWSSRASPPRRSAPSFPAALSNDILARLGAFGRTLRDDESIVVAQPGKRAGLLLGDWRDVRSDSAPQVGRT
jgi:hypothetical protein